MVKSQSIYMDYHATTPIDPEVLDEMVVSLKNHYGNSASPHYDLGHTSHELVEKARQQIAHLIGAESKEIIFSSGATESNNLAIKGVCDIYKDKGKHIVTCVTEHSSVLDTCKFLEESGFEVTYLPVEADGRISLDMLSEAITDQTILISIMFANNEIGVLQPIRDIGALAKSKGIVFHTDATQVVGKIPVNVMEDNIDLMSFSSHKLYGPKGVGALYVRSREPRIRLQPMIHGGGHENGLRSGTLNVPGIVGFGKACEVCEQKMSEDSRYLTGLRDLLLTGICSQVEGVFINGSMEHRLPHNLNLSFNYIEGESLLKGLGGDIAVSSSSACTSSSLNVSYVLQSLGISQDLIHASLRFGLGRFNTEEEVGIVVKRIVDVVNRLRSNSTLYQILKQNQGKDLSLGKNPGE